MSLKLAPVIISITAACSMVGAFIVLDDRYNNAGISQQLEGVKNAIVNEMRSEVSTNRSSLLILLQRNADDDEFSIRTIETDGEQAPRYLLERLKATQRQIEDLRNATDTPDTSVK